MADLVYLNVVKVAEHSPDCPRPAWWEGSMIWLVCRCGTIASLSDTHRVDAEGHVQPGILCGHCKLQEHIKLLGWSEGYVELVIHEEPKSSE